MTTNPIVCETCGGSFADSAAEFAHNCERLDARFTRIPSNFGTGTTTVRATSVQAAPKRQNLSELFDYDDALAKTQTWMAARFADRKLVDADVTMKLQWLAEQYAVRYEGTFEYMVEMKSNMEHKRSLSVGQARGVLNCIRADALRNTPPVRRPEPEPISAVDGGPLYPSYEEQKRQAVSYTESGLDLRDLPKSSHGILRVAVPDHSTGDWIFLEINQARRNGDIVVCQSVGGNEPLYLGRQQTRQGKTYIGKRQAEIRTLLEDPIEAIRQFGLNNEHCGLCNTELTLKRSLEAGYGQKCARKLGVDW